MVSEIELGIQNPQVMIPKLGHPLTSEPPTRQLKLPADKLDDRLSSHSR
jgi:hypothetical protein